MNKFRMGFIFLGLLVSMLLSCKGSEKKTVVGSEIGFNETGFPIVSKPLTLKAIAQKNDITMDFNTLPVFIELEKKTGIHINFDYAGADWATQKPLVLASGDLPDFFFNKNVLGESDVIGNMELFVQLDPLIEKYAPNIKSILTKDADFRRFNTAYDGHIYGLSQRMPRRPEIYTVSGINQKWLDELHLPMPTTTEEFYQTLKAFKKRDPNCIPFSYLGFNSLHGMMEWFGPFGIAESINQWLSVTNGKVQYIPVQDGFKDAIAYFNRLYAEGLMDNEIFTQNRAQLTAKQNPPAGQPDRVGVSGTWSRDLAFGSQRKVNYTVIVPIKGPKGDQIWRRNKDVVQGAKYVFEITSACKYPEAVMRWVDCLYDEMVSMQLYYGPVGEYIDVRSDGTFYIVPPPSNYTESQWRWRMQTNDLSVCYVSDETSAKIIDPQFDEQLLDKANYLMPYTPKEYYPSVAMTPEENSELSTLRTDIQNYVENQVATWIANGGVEKEYDAFLRQLDAMGLRRMVQIYQTAYDRYMRQ